MRLDCLTQLPLNLLMFNTNILSVYLGHVANQTEGHCTTLKCKYGNNNLKAANCTLKDYSVVGRCGKYL